MATLQTPPMQPVVWLVRQQAMSCKLGRLGWAQDSYMHQVTPTTMRQNLSYLLIVLFVLATHMVTQQDLVLLGLGTEETFLVLVHLFC